jgi:hypothetical protein
VNKCLIATWRIALFVPQRRVSAGSPFSAPIVRLHWLSHCSYVGAFTGKPLACQDCAGFSLEKNAQA